MKNEPKFNGVFSRNNLPKIKKDGTYITNLCTNIVPIYFFLTNMKRIIRYY